MVAREQRSPGFGPSLAFPVAQWRRERGYAPVTVAGPRRIHTGFRASALVNVGRMIGRLTGRGKVHADSG
jgi:hypothetical protein